MYPAPRINGIVDLYNILIYNMFFGGNMSFCAYIVRVDYEGEKIAKLFESEIPAFQQLYDTFKEHFIVESENAYHIGDIIDEISKTHNISMTDYYVSEDGYNVWVDDQDEPINIPLDKIPQTHENTYTLFGTTVMSVYDEPEKYKSWIYKTGKSYIIDSKDWKKALSFFPKKHKIHEYADKGLLIFNSF